MRARLAAMALLWTFGGARWASASEWRPDPSHSRVGFSVRHLMISEVEGRFTRFGGRLHLDESNIERSRVVMTIEVSSLTTHHVKRDEHLLSEDFFYAEKYPRMVFESKRVLKRGAELEVHGNLNVRGITKPVVIKVESWTSAVQDPWGRVRRGLKATTTINRSDFGLRWNRALESGGVMVGQEVTITLGVQWIRAD